MNIKDLLKEFNVVIHTPEGLAELRSLILGLAVRGKLVPQDPNDESASELLKKIEAEKERLYDEGEIRKPRKLKPQKKDELPFDLPDSWLWCRIGDLAKVQGGGTPKTSENENWSDEGIPWVTPADLNNLDSKYIQRGKRDISDTGLSGSSTFLLPKGSVLFSSRAPIGYVAIAENDICTNQGFQSAIPYITATNDFIYYYLKYVGKVLDERASGTTFKEVSGTFVANVEFPLPPLAEQHRIVQRIESLFAEVDELEAKLKQQTKLDEKLQLAVNAEVQKAPNAEASKTAWNFITSNFDTLYHTPEAIDNLKKNILNEAVRGRLVPQDPNDEPVSELLKKIEAEKERLYEEGEIRKPKDLPPVKDDEVPFEIPESWELTRLATVSNIEMGQSPPGNTYNKDGDGVPLINGPVEFGKGPLAKTKVVQYSTKPKKYCKEGDLLLCVRGSTLGRTNIAGFDACIGRGVAAIQPYFEGIYLHYFIVSERKNIYDFGTGSTFPSINKGNIENYIFPLPPLKEQDRIVQRIEELFAICDRHKAQLEQRQVVNERLVKGLVGEVLERSQDG